LADEAAWDAAGELRKRGFMVRDPIPLDDVEGYLDFFGRDADVITFGNRWGQHGPDYDLAYLRDKVQALRDRAEAPLAHPGSFAR
jgi:alkyl sulfatase BDS1-like metallo-beta-lactamase superfamily hydrolase